MTAPDPIRGRCAVVYNPTKISDQFRDLVEKTLQRDGWVDTLWLETSATDPGPGDDPPSRGREG